MYFFVASLLLLLPFIFIEMLLFRVFKGVLYRILAVLALAFLPIIFYQWIVYISDSSSKGIAAWTAWRGRITLFGAAGIYIYHLIFFAAYFAGIYLAKFIRERYYGR